MCRTSRCDVSRHIGTLLPLKRKWSSLMERSVVVDVPTPVVIISLLPLSKQPTGPDTPRTRRTFLRDIGTDRGSQIKGTSVVLVQSLAQTSRFYFISTLLLMSIFLV